MNIFSLLSFTAFIIYLYFGIYVIKLEKKSKLNIIFFLMCLNFANWSFGYTFIYPETNIKIAMLWYKVTTFGWCTVNSFLLHFFLILTGKDKKIKDKFLYILLYTPAIIFSYKSITGTLLLKGFRMGPFGQIEIHTSNTIWKNSFLIYFISYLLLGFFILYRWGKKSKNSREQKQARIIFYTAIFPIVVGLCTNIILPTLGIGEIPAIGQILVLIWILGIWISIIKYKLMILTPKVASDEIFIKIKDLLIIVDKNLNIIDVNPSFLQMFKYKEEDLKNRNLKSLLNKKYLENTNIEKLISSCINIQLELISSEGEIIPVNISSEQIKDISGDVVGDIIVGQDLRPMKQLIEEVIKRKNLLDNAGQGFLSFGESLLVEKEYSLECKNIFQKEINNCFFPELIYSRDKENKMFLKDILTKILLLEDEDEKEIYVSLLPTEVSINKQFIHIQYKIIDNCGNHKFMIVLTNITEKKKLENKIENERNILRMVVKVVTNYNLFNTLKKDYKNFCDYDIKILLDNKDLTSAFYGIKRVIHNFKGNFSILEMQNIVKCLHDLESKFDALEDNTENITKEDIENLLEESNLLTILEKDYEILKNILGDEFFKNKNCIQVEPRKIIDIERKITSIFSLEECKDILRELKNLRCKTLNSLLSHYIEYVNKLSEKLEKNINTLVLEGDKILVEPDKYVNFIHSLTHIFRNSVDHGIENEYDRIDAGKDIYGTIKCIYKLRQDSIVITIEDDGRGIDVNLIKEKAISKGLLDINFIDTMKEEDILNLIFEDGFSTKDIVSQYSGRGVGLAAVKDTVEKLQGTICLKSKLNKGTQFIITLPYKNEYSSKSLDVYDILNPVSQNALKLIKEYSLDTSFSVKNPVEFSESKNLQLKEITALIHIQGMAEGIFMLSVTKEAGRKIAYKFLLEEILAENEQELIEGSITEFLNIILGNSLHDFPPEYRDTIIKPPIILTSSNCNIKYYVYTIWSYKINDDVVLSFIIGDEWKRNK